MRERKPRGYWKDFSIVERELKPIIKELGHFPTQTELKERGYTGMSSAVQDNHGGLNCVRERMGYKLNTKPSGYWTDKENVLREIDLLLKNQNTGTLPSLNWMGGNGCGSLAGAIIKHGGFLKFRRELGETNIRISSDQLKDLKYCIGVANAATRDNDWETLPGQSILNKRGYGSLVGAVQRYHGGFQVFRQAIGEKNSKKPSGTWRNREFVLSEAKIVMRKHKWTKLPSTNMLRQNNYQMLVHAIVRYHGGMNEVRQLLGETPQRVKHGSWRDVQFTLGQAVTFMEEHQEYSTLPSRDVLNKHGLSSLGGAINIYHGGFSVFREILDEHLGLESERERLEGLLLNYIGGKG